MNRITWAKYLSSRTLPKSRCESEWEECRRKYPYLQLVRIEGDDLSVLWTDVHAKVSLSQYHLVQNQVLSQQWGAAALALVEFFKTHPVTFLSSGWVKTTLAEILLEDEQAGRKFMTSYWREKRSSRAKARLRAHEALTLVDGPHRSHWLAATKLLKTWYLSDFRPPEKAWRFAERVVQKYRDRPGRRCACLKDEALFVIALQVASDPDARVHEVTDLALAKLHNISASTLAHERGSLRSRKKH